MRLPGWMPKPQVADVLREIDAVGVMLDGLERDLIWLGLPHIAIQVASLALIRAGNELREAYGQDHTEDKEAGAQAQANQKAADLARLADAGRDVRVGPEGDGGEGAQGAEDAEG